MLRTADVQDAHADITSSSPLPPSPTDAPSASFVLEALGVREDLREEVWSRLVERARQSTARQQSEALREQGRSMSGGGKVDGRDGDGEGEAWGRTERLLCCTCFRHCPGAEWCLERVAWWGAWSVHGCAVMVGPAVRPCAQACAGRNCSGCAASVRSLALASLHLAPAVRALCEILAWSVAMLCAVMLSVLAIGGADVWGLLVPVVAVVLVLIVVSNSPCTVLDIRTLISSNTTTPDEPPSPNTSTPSTTPRPSLPRPPSSPYL
jgi:hypothetical protein